MAVVVVSLCSPTRTGVSLSSGNLMQLDSGPGRHSEARCSDSNGSTLSHAGLCEWPSDCDLHGTVWQF